MAFSRRRPHTTLAVPRIDATPKAAAALAEVEGLRERVEQSLLAILEAAREIRRLSAIHRELGLDDHFLRVRVGDHMVSYTLDPSLSGATVVFVEELEPRVEPALSKAS
jgi:hypothetical protein